MNYEVRNFAERSSSHLPKKFTTHEQFFMLGVKQWFTPKIVIFGNGSAVWGSFLGL